MGNWDKIFDHMHLFICIIIVSRALSQISLGCPLRHVTALKKPTSMAAHIIDSAGERILIGQVDPVRLGARGPIAIPGAWTASWPGVPAYAAKYHPERAPH